MCYVMFDWFRGKKKVLYGSGYNAASNFILGLRIRLCTLLEDRDIV